MSQKKDATLIAVLLQIPDILTAYGTLAFVALDSSDRANSVALTH